LRLVCDPRQVSQALVNILKNAAESIHARADAGVPGHIVLRGSAADGQIVLAVEDNGRGFSGEIPSTQDGHFGLTGMKERAQQIGGSLTVSSKQGQGTRVCVEMPMDEKE